MNKRSFIFNEIFKLIKFCILQAYTINERNEKKFFKTILVIKVVIHVKLLEYIFSLNFVKCT